MKKISVSVLAFLLLTCCIACRSVEDPNEVQEKTTVSTQDTGMVAIDDVDQLSTRVFSEYRDILDATILLSKQGKMDMSTSFEQDVFIWNSLQTIEKGGLGYCIKDINGDGIEELILLSPRLQARALYTLRGGEPMLVTCFEEGGINKDGNIFTVQRVTTTEYVHTVYSRSRLEERGLIAESKFEEYAYTDGTYKCSRINGTERESISHADVQQEIVSLGFLHYPLMMEDAGITYTKLLDTPEVLERHAHYALMRQGETQLYEIYDSDGTVVLTGNSERVSLFMVSDEVIYIGAWSENGEYMVRFYHTRYGQFSEELPLTIAQNDRYVAFFDDTSAGVRVLVIRDIFDKSAYYCEVEHEVCKGAEVNSAAFSEDGHSLEIRYRKSQNERTTTGVIALSPILVLQCRVACYVRTDTEIGDNHVYLSSSERAVLRPEMGDMVRLLDEQPVQGGEYIAVDGMRRCDWYHIEYQGQECYVTADSFDVLPLS